MDGPSIQLQETLDSSIRRAFTSHRPILTHLNADTSWLIQLPFPPDAARPPGRSRWNLLLDPWFQGPQSDVAKFFSTQWHTVDSSVQTMAELSQRLEEIEALVLGESRVYRRKTCVQKTSQTSYIDAVVISHEFTDHCNKRTLLELDPETPIFATKRAVDLIRSWNFFHCVQEIPSFSRKRSDWRKTSLQPLPSWLGISQMVSQSDALDYHSAILVTFDLYSSRPSVATKIAAEAEAMIYTPHGIHTNDLNPLLHAFPPVKTLVLLHGLHDIQISIQRLNLGAHNGLQAQRICRSKYWVSTHDEIKRATGLITPWLYRNVLTLQEALSEERRVQGEMAIGSDRADVREVTFKDLTSGESLLLD